MKLHKGIWFPDHEQHMLEWCDKNGEMIDGKTTYQYKKWLACIPYIKQWRNAVDCGSHIGFWSAHMAKRFQHVSAFEPILEHRECFALNVPDSNVTVHTCALESEPGLVSLTIPEGSSGGTHISGHGDIQLRTLDSFGIDELDFLKIDTEGYELAVLQGARETLLRCKPCVIVEQKPHTIGGQKHLPAGGPQTPAVDYLRDLGAYLRTVKSGDFILAWD
jgi:FkbM family methyltransferase